MNILEPSDLKPLFENNFKLGEDQIDSPHATASHDVQKHFKNFVPNVELGIMSYNFPVTEWENQGWISWLKKVCQKYNAKIKVVGGPKVQARDTIQRLMDDEVIEFRLLNEPETFHVLYADNPRQLWVEEYHSYSTPQKIHYTKTPYENVWQKLISLFNKVWERGKSVNKLGAETIEDVNPTHLIAIYLSNRKEVKALTFYTELKKITNNLHSKSLAREINFVPDRFSGYWSREISESLGDLFTFGFIRSFREGKTLFYELTDKGKKLPDYYKETPAWKTLEKYSQCLPFKIPVG